MDIETRAGTYLPSSEHWDREKRFLRSEWEAIQASTVILENVYERARKSGNWQSLAVLNVVGDDLLVPRILDAGLEPVENPRLSQLLIGVRKPQKQTPTEKESIMGKETIQNSLTTLGGFVKDGIEEGVVQEGSDMLLQLFVGLFGDQSYAMNLLKSEAGKQGALLFMAMGCHYFGDLYPSMMGAHTAKVQRVCGVIVKNSVRELIGPKLSLVKEYGLKLGQSASAIELVGETVEEASYEEVSS